MVEVKELKEKALKYGSLTEQALGKVKLRKDLTEKEKAVALDFLDMAKRYFSDGRHYQEKNDFLTALASFSYAHAWLDAGVRARFFDVGKESRLFTLP